MYVVITVPLLCVIVRCHTLYNVVGEADMTEPVYMVYPSGRGPLIGISFVQPTNV